MIPRQQKRYLSFFDTYRDRDNPKANKAKNIITNKKGFLADVSQQPTFGGMFAMPALKHNPTRKQPRNGMKRVDEGVEEQAEEEDLLFYLEENNGEVKNGKKIYMDGKNDKKMLKKEEIEMDKIKNKKSQEIKNDENNIGKNKSVVTKNIKLRYGSYDNLQTSKFGHNNIRENNENLINLSSNDEEYNLILLDIDNPETTKDLNPKRYMEELRQELLKMYNSDSTFIGEQELFECALGAGIEPNNLEYENFVRDEDKHFNKCINKGISENENRSKLNVLNIDSKSGKVIFRIENINKLNSASRNDEDFPYEGQKEEKPVVVKGFRDLSSEKSEEEQNEVFLIQHFITPTSSNEHLNISNSSSITNTQEEIPSSGLSTQKEVFTSKTLQKSIEKQIRENLLRQHSTFGKNEPEESNSSDGESLKRNKIKKSRQQSKKNKKKEHLRESESENENRKYKKKKYKHSKGEKEIKKQKVIKEKNCKRGRIYRKDLESSESEKRHRAKKRKYKQIVCNSDSNSSKDGGMKHSYHHKSKKAKYYTNSSSSSSSASSCTSSSSSSSSSSDEKNYHTKKPKKIIKHQFEEDSSPSPPSKQTKLIPLNEKTVPRNKSKDLPHKHFSSLNIPKGNTKSFNIKKRKNEA